MKYEYEPMSQEQIGEGKNYVNKLIAAFTELSKVKNGDSVGDLMWFANALDFLLYPDLKHLVAEVAEGYFKAMGFKVKHIYPEDVGLGQN